MFDVAADSILVIENIIFRKVFLCSAFVVHVSIVDDTVCLSNVLVALTHLSSAN